MKRKYFYLFLFLGIVSSMCAQSKGRPDKKMLENWEVKVNTMDDHRRQKITALVEEMQGRGGATRSLVSDLLNIVKTNAVSTSIDVVSTEVFDWVNYRKKRKEEWKKMIDRECFYADSLTYMEGLHDFYSETSRHGALDPSHMNFNGISVRGIHDGQEFMYLSCHIDTTRIEHLFRHSKFYLVVDSIVFNPYECHLPNLEANGIINTLDTERNNRFSFDERDNLTFGMELSVFSSWINQAVMLQQNVPLGAFKLNVRIPSGVDTYTYSRAQILANRRLMKDNPSLRLDTTLVQMEGECFVVPRSYMPISGTEPMWGTGEYNIKVKFQERCQFIRNKDRNEKERNWHTDYKQLRKLQNRDKGVMKSVSSYWKQNGNTMVKTIVKQYLTSAASSMGLSGSTSGGVRVTGGTSTGGSAAGGAKPQGGMPGGFSK